MSTVADSGIGAPGETELILVDRCPTGGFVVHPAATPNPERIQVRHRRADTAFTCNNAQSHRHCHYGTPGATPVGQEAPARAGATARSSGPGSDGERRLLVPGWARMGRSARSKRLGRAG